ncbi:MAG TPA: HAD-IIIA family hydrolase [Gammaproteobacteria bacterium]|jgi:D-glycero-D-manno-heptose 1,7-bisphosphate phosphatase|nr:HAD-IIIA family hydrolase [Gammaproteobacteria bacterium]
MPQKAIFLDRDGVLNDTIIKQGKPYPPASLAELTIAADVLPALQLLKSHNCLLIGATNQPDVPRGITLRSTVESINQHLLTILPLDTIRVCYHDDQDACACRKPAPGLLLQAATDYHIDLSQSVMIGDRWKDIVAGQQAGCKTVWINRHYAEPAPKTPDAEVTSLLAAAEWIVANG